MACAACIYGVELLQLASSIDRHTVLVPQYYLFSDDVSSHTPPRRCLMSCCSDRCTNVPIARADQGLLQRSEMQLSESDKGYLNSMSTFSLDLALKKYESALCVPTSVRSRHRLVHVVPILTMATPFFS